MHTKPCDAVDSGRIVVGSFSCPSLEDRGGLRVSHFPDRKEAHHGGDSSVVDEGGLVRRVKL